MSAFSVLSVVERSFRIFFEDLPLFVGVGLLVNLPLALLELGLQYIGPLDLAALGFVDPSTSNVVVGAFFTLTMLLVVLVTRSLTTAALIHGVFRRIRKERATIGECVQTALSQTGSVVLYTLLSSVAIGIGFAMCVLPGAVLAAIWYVGLPAVVAEQRGALDGFGRSAALTSGNQVEILGLLVLVFALEWVVGAAASNLTVRLWELAPILGFATDNVLSAFFVALNAVFTAVTYHDLRVAREGIDSDELASVFD